MTASPKFLVIDGYAKAARDELAAGGCTVAGELYAGMLSGICPGAVCDIVYPSDPGAALPAGAAITDYDAIAWTGCSLTIFHDTPEVRAQIDFARAVYQAGLPSFGSCWGAQIAVVAAGGEVKVNPKGREMGLARKIQLTPEGRDHPMYEGKSDVFDAFISHEDEVTGLAQGAVVLAGNGFTRVQSVAVTHQKGTFWGLQYHPEYDLREMARLTYCRIEKLSKLGFFNSREDALGYVKDLEDLHQDHTRKDIAWRLGIDEDVMDEDYRRIEVKNWIDKLVIPSMGG